MKIGPALDIGQIRSRLLMKKGRGGGPEVDGTVMHEEAKPYHKEAISDPYFIVSAKKGVIS